MLERRLAAINCGHSNSKQVSMTKRKEKRHFPCGEGLFGLCAMYGYAFR
jgi:hypothetical protein